MRLCQPDDLYHLAVWQALMAIELTVMEVVLSGVLVFLAGLFGLLACYRLRSTPKESALDDDSPYLQRLEYYESQMVELKIRLDALMLGAGPASPRTKGAFYGVGEEARGPAAKAASRDAGPEPRPLAETQVRHVDLTNHILQLITNKSMTSRDIQSVTGQSREHTSRQMKKMTESGLVKRHSNARPFTYSITEQGKNRLAGQD